MRPSAFRKSVYVVLVCALVAFLLGWPTTMQADQAQYFYDELGRLVGVIDGAGNVAVYTYDEVGDHQLAFSPKAVTCRLLRGVCA